MANSVTSPKPIASRPSNRVPTNAHSPNQSAARCHANQRREQCPPVRAAHAPRDPDTDRGDRADRQNPIRESIAQQHASKRWSSARRRPCRVRHERGNSAKHHAQTQASPAASECTSGVPSNSLGQGHSRGAEKVRKSSLWAIRKAPAGMPTSTITGSSTVGNKAAKNNPKSVPGTVISSGINPSSMSISDATNISTDRQAWLAKTQCNATIAWRRCPAFMGSNRAFCKIAGSNRELGSPISQA